MRNNENRSGARQSTESDVPKKMANPLDFITPTEFATLPSKGKTYPQGHPLHNQETIEIRFMTAKDEDILTSRALLKSGLALDRLINNLIVNEAINASDLLIGDRNAILVAARGSAYGYRYETNASCPACTESSKHVFNLAEPAVYNGFVWEEYNVSETDEGTFMVTLPYSELLVEIRMLTGKDELKLIKKMQKNSKKKQVDNTLSEQMKMYIVSVNGYSDRQVVDHVVKSITATESRYLRNAYKSISPDLKIVGDFECPSCGHEQELEVPFGADFFWPDR